MANHAQAKKRIRQVERRTAANNIRRTRIRTFVRKVALPSQLHVLDIFSAVHL